jgi:hypothetical protein
MHITEAIPPSGEAEDTEAVAARPINIARETVVLDIELAEPDVIEAATE